MDVGSGIHGENCCEMERIQRTVAVLRNDKCLTANFELVDCLFFICHCLTLNLLATPPQSTGQYNAGMYQLLVASTHALRSLQTFIKHSDHWQTQVTPNRPPESIHFQ